MILVNPKPQSSSNSVIGQGPGPGIGGWTVTLKGSGLEGLLLSGGGGGHPDNGVFPKGCQVLPSTVVVDAGNIHGRLPTSSVKNPMRVKPAAQKLSSSHRFPVSKSPLQ